MSEAEWFACADPQKMLEFLRFRVRALRKQSIQHTGRVGDQQARLFAAACCRQPRRPWDSSLA